MKTKTQTVYQILYSSTRQDIIFEVSDWEMIIKWEEENFSTHPDWRITQYQIRSVVTVETIIK